MRADQVRDVLLPGLQGIEEEFRRGELVLVWGVLEQLVRFIVGSFFFRLRAREAEVLKRVFLVEQQAIEEGILAVDSVAEDECYR